MIWNIKFHQIRCWVVQTLFLLECPSWLASMRATTTHVVILLLLLFIIGALKLNIISFILLLLVFKLLISRLWIELDLSLMLSLIHNIFYHFVIGNFILIILLLINNDGCVVGGGSLGSLLTWFLTKFTILFRLFLIDHIYWLIISRGWRFSSWSLRLILRWLLLRIILRRPRQLLTIPTTALITSTLTLATTITAWLASLLFEGEFSCVYVFVLDIHFVKVELFVDLKALLEFLIFFFTFLWIFWAFAIGWIWCRFRNLIIICFILTCLVIFSSLIALIIWLTLIIFI